MRRKATFRSNRGQAPMQQFACVTVRSRTAVYMPLHGFTAADLGYERGNAVSNLVTKIDEPPMTAHYLSALRPDLERPREARGRHRTALRPHRLRLPGELARTDLLPDPLQPLHRVPRRHQRGRSAERPHRLPGHLDLEEALQLPAGRRDRDHQQARDLQRLHPRRQRRPREDVHRARGHQVLRAAQQVRPRALPQEARRQLDELQQQPDDEHLRQRPLQLRRPLPHRPAPHQRRVVRHSAQPDQLGQLRPRRDRRVAQLPQRRRLQGPRDALPAADDAGHPARA